MILVSENKVSSVGCRTTANGKETTAYTGTESMRVRMTLTPCQLFTSISLLDLKEVEADSDCIQMCLIVRDKKKIVVKEASVHLEEHSG
ncbi:hypothetical protein TNCV_2640281 [Trichonephila clavipes]|nr:hypothetical protein TNCV_2640281 [Trichonephila clavipes]